jgi:hypothetical protein
MADLSAHGNGELPSANTPIGTAVPRETLPIPDPQHVGLTTYDAKDPDTIYPPN